MNRFKTNLRDFLIQLREFSGDAENAELFLEDKEAAAEAKKQEERARAAAVPGMLKCVFSRDRLCLYLRLLGQTCRTR